MLLYPEYQSAKAQHTLKYNPWRNIFSGFALIIKYYQSQDNNKIIYIIYDIKEEHLHKSRLS